MEWSRRTRSGRKCVYSQRVVIKAFLSLLLISSVHAGIRSTGKYSGVVIFDRWGGCTLYSGVYLMYVSDSVKSQLRPEAGKCVQIDAREVDQPRNPGDGLIRQLTLLGPAPDSEFGSVDGLKLKVTPDFSDPAVPQFLISVENTGQHTARVDLSALAPTVLKKGTAPPADGPSTAVITRNSFWSIDKAQSTGGSNYYEWQLTSPLPLNQGVSIAPQASFDIKIALKLRPGEYEFVAGYGGGVHSSRCIASNLAGFDIRQDGTAHVVPAAAP